MLKKQISFFLIFMSFVFFACKKNQTASPKDFGYDFYPLKLHSVVFYSVDSTVYSTFTTLPTLYQFTLKDSIADFFINETKDTVYRIERYKKRKGEITWNYQKTISRFINKRIAEEQIDNKKFIKMVFPAEVGVNWNANSKNDLPENIFSIEEKFDSFSLNNKNYPKTIKISFEEKNLIREDINKAWYTKGIGLIMSEITAVDKDFDTGKITNGYIYMSKIQSP